VVRYRTWKTKIARPASSFAKPCRHSVPASFIPLAPGRTEQTLSWQGVLAIGVLLRASAISRVWYTATANYRRQSVFFHSKNIFLAAFADFNYYED